ncbi:MAG: hypothetical protein OEX19_12365 [Gammaproteobacteria bacterium]|nr:hypothetical protein [Gammaproteobacteria bacterium]
MKYQYRRTATLALVLASPTVFAVAPVAYDGWSVSGGTIDTTASCTTAGVSCTNLVSDPGMVYEEVTTGGSKFLRLILTDQGATGAPNQLNFTTETFIPYAQLGDPLPPGSIAHYQGIAAKQVVRDAADSFEGVTEVQRANMRQLGSLGADDMFTIKLSQGFGNADISSAFAHTSYTQFSSGGTTIDSDQVIGRITDIQQSNDVGGTDNPGASQLFVQRTRDGTKGNSNFSFGGSYFVTAPITTAGSMNVSAAAATPGAPVSWINKADISTTWIVQDNNISTAPGIAIAYQSIKNNDTLAEDVMRDFELPVGTADPFAWETNFGTAPTFP